MIVMTAQSVNDPMSALIACHRLLIPAYRSTSRMSTAKSAGNRWSGAGSERSAAVTAQ
jgi:hypothetical protein